MKNCYLTNSAKLLITKSLYNELQSIKGNDGIEIVNAETIQTILQELEVLREKNSTIPVFIYKPIGKPMSVDYHLIDDQQKEAENTVLSIEVRTISYNLLRK